MNRRERLRREWKEPAPVAVPEALRAAVGGRRLLVEHLVRIGITSPASAQRFLSAANYSPAPAADLPDIDRAVERLERAIRAKERILIWGDFDVDGQTATALLYSALSRRGAQVKYHVPNRFSEGHGIHLPTLKQRLDHGVDLILTCDTGVTAHEAVDYAASRGVEALITDHHALPEALPAAVVVNSQRLPAGHPLRELPGVGVAYKLIEALDPDGADDLLDLVALGIVSDVMAQVDDTRYLLQRGLERLRENRRLGIRAILERAGIPAADLNEGHIGFAIAPRLNALGRLDDASAAVELLTSDDWARARVLAHRLESYNARRKYLSNQVYESALAQIENEPWLLDYAALVLSQSDWHSGVIGIVASRLVEEFARPAVLIAAPAAVGRGSARSIAGVDITNAFGQVAHLLDRYGGHSMAAGLSLPADSIVDFRRALSTVIRGLGVDLAAAPALNIDGYVNLSDVSDELTADIERLAPFGNGNPPLTLAARDLKLAGSKGLGRRREHLQVEVEDADGRRQPVIWWRGAAADLPQGRFDLAFTLRTSSYKGKRETLVEWLDYRSRSEAPVDLQPAEPAYEMIDYRASAAPRADLESALAQYPDALVWAEVQQPPGAVSRLQLDAAATLVVWTAPPSAQIWSAALRSVNPERLILFGRRPDARKTKETKETKAFLERLAGLVKFAVSQRGGEAGLEEMAAALGERERAAQSGLQVLGALGKLDFQATASGRYQLALVKRERGDDLAQRLERLEGLLRESRAYRNYWLKMEIGG